MYLSSKQLDVMIELLDTKLSHMLVDGCDNVENSTPSRGAGWRCARPEPPVVNETGSTGPGW